MSVRTLSFFVIPWLGATPVKGTDHVLRIVS